MKYILAVALLFINSFSYAALNKWVDADGKVHYSDSAPVDVKVKKIKSTAAPEPLTSSSESSAPKSIAEREADWKKSQQSKAEAEQKAAQKQEETQLKKINCDGARSNLATLENSPSIVTYNPQGERIFLDEASRAQRIEEARKAVTNYCN